jgi:SAM-dependent methyltransferase
MTIRFASNPASKYIAATPLALALERALECLLLSRQKLNAPVLDIGCGDGLFASILFADKIDTGIDLNPAELACAAKTGAYNELICCSGSKIPKSSGTYQTVFSNSVLEHIPDVAPVLREAHRLLQPGGSFVFTVPTDQFEQNSVIFRVLKSLRLSGSADRFRKWYNRFWRHFHAYNPRQWQQLTTDAGFEVEEMVRYNSPGMTTRNDCLTPVAVLSSILKRWTGRWVLWPRLRRVFFAGLGPKIQRNLLRSGVTADGTLLLVRARKVLENPR